MKTGEILIRIPKVCPSHWSMYKRVNQVYQDWVKTGEILIRISKGCPSHWFMYKRVSIRTGWRHERFSSESPRVVHHIGWCISGLGEDRRFSSESPSVVHHIDWCMSGLVEDRRDSYQNPQGCPSLYMGLHINWCIIANQNIRTGGMQDKLLITAVRQTLTKECFLT